jgi:hypothetical protein
MNTLFLNFFEYKLQNDYFDINYLPYSDYCTKETYLDLRRSYPDYMFYVQKPLEDSNEKIIYFWKTNENQSNLLEGEKQRILINESPKIVSKIIESCFISMLNKSRNFSIKRNRYENAWEITSKKESLEDIFYISAKNSMKLSFCFFNQNNSLFFGFFISRKIKFDLEINIDGFKEKNIDYRDLKIKDDKVYPNKQSINRVLESTGQYSLFQEKIRNLDNNEKSFQFIKKFFDWFNKRINEFYLPSKNSFTKFSMNNLPLENNKIESKILPTPKRFYYENRTDRKGLYNEVVARLKPYSFANFEKKIIRVAVICPKYYEGSLDTFLLKLEQSLKNIFHLEINIKTVFLENTSTYSYSESIYNEKIIDSDLFLIILEKNHFLLDAKNNPYYVCKAKLIGQGIPTQQVQANNIKKINPYIINNIALNIYAKIGGTAWTIEKIEKRTEELIIGVGASVNSDGKFILGIAQIFHSDGRYLVGDCSPLSTFENYSENLEKYLYNIILFAMDNLLLNKKKEFRLIFHLFKSASHKYEISAVEKVIDKFKNENITFKYSFVHLAYGHNFRLFTNEGKFFLNNNNKNVNETKKGTYIELSKYRALVHFIPKSTIPLEIDIDKRSTFYDLEYISKQVYWFSHLSHRTFLPSKRTVTLLYPSIMAELLEKLQEVEGWDNKRAEKIKDKLWFI